MRIEHGRYVLTNKLQVENALKEQNRRIALQQAQLAVVLEWTKGQLALHQPYTHALDVSCHEPAKMAEAIGNKLKRDIWCARCSNPWPCPHITSLRLLRDAARNNDAESLEAAAVQIRALPKPKRAAGQIDVML